MADVMLGDRKVAQGQIVVCKGNYGIKVLDNV